MVDFVCLEKRLIIEFDDGQHMENQMYAMKGTDWLMAHEFNLFTGLTGVWTNRDLIRARVRGRDRARPNPINLIFEPIWSAS
jgi:hypothetical protein